MRNWLFFSWIGFRFPRVWGVLGLVSSILLVLILLVQEWNLYLALHQGRAAPWEIEAIEHLLWVTLAGVSALFILWTIFFFWLQKAWLHQREIQAELEQEKIELLAQATRQQSDLSKVNEQLRQEIDKRQHTQEFLMLLTQAVEATSDGITIADAQQGNILIYANPGFCQLTGYTLEETLGKNCRFLQGPSTSQESLSHLRQTLQTSHAFRGELLNFRKDGTSFWNQLSINPIFNEKGELTHFVGVQKDVTAHHQGQLELRQAKEAAEAANQAKSQFLANMSHEIRTPLNAILGFSQLLLNNPYTREVPLEYRNYLGHIVTSGEHLSEVINNILDLSKIEAGKMPLSRELVSLKQLIQGAFHIQKTQAEEKGVKFSYDIDPQLPFFFITDRTKLNQILLNLLSNAIKFTSKGQHVWLKAFLEGSHLIVQIQDEGIGIPAERQKMIFEAFEQVDGSVTRKFGGTGLGLAIAQKMAEILGGQISLQSTPGEGSTFRLRLPIQSASTLEVYEKSNLLSVRFAPGYQILLVEDNPINRAMTQAWLENLGLQVRLATNGKEAVEEVQKQWPHLIFMDLHMPEMDGITAIQHLRAMPQGEKLPIIALSANAFIQQQEQAYQTGVQEYLTKPLEPEKLIETLKKYLTWHPLPEKDLLHSAFPPLPPEREELLRQEWEKLRKIPYYDGGQIIDQLQTMQTLCMDYESPWSERLNALKDALFTGNSEQFALFLDAPDG